MKTKTAIEIRRELSLISGRRTRLKYNIQAKEKLKIMNTPKVNKILESNIEEYTQDLKQLEQEKVNLALQLEINRLKLQAFEEDIREQNNSQLLNG